jgi:type IV secretory pathway VirB2 component (pilin)
MLSPCLALRKAPHETEDRPAASFPQTVKGENFPSVLEATSYAEAVVMKRFVRRANSLLRSSPRFVTLVAGFFLAAPAFAQANSPWENAVGVLQQAFTSTIARGLSLVAIVVSGLTFAFGEGGSKRVLAGVLFGVGMAIASVNFLAWLFP